MKKKKVKTEPESCLYVVMRFGFEYNDEINYRPDNGGGDPIKVFSDKTMAETYCEHLNIKSMRSAIGDYGGLASYFYDLRDIDSTGKLESVLASLKVSTEHGNSSDVELSDDEVRSILNNCSLRFYTIEAVELGGTSDVYGAMLEGKKI